MVAILKNGPKTTWDQKEKLATSFFYIRKYKYNIFITVAKIIYKIFTTINFIT